MIRKEKTERYELVRKPIAKKESVVQGEKYRFTILTDYLIRMEYQEDGFFTDEPTQTVICRDFPVPEYKVIDGENKLEIITGQLHLYYDKNPFTSEGLFIGLKVGYKVGDPVWNYGEPIKTLKGTARTLDNADGAVELEEGLLSKGGYTVWDDSKSALLTADGWVSPRKYQCQDLYFFGYGHNYQLCIKDFFHLCGETPLLPKYALGNWWSRFYPYDENGYLELMEEFEEKNLPFAVSVLDMDWHMTKVPKKYGSGWTGYTWNKELFPDPERFLKKLHQMGKKVTLNLHPADGVRAFEDAYLPMAKELGVDYEQEEKIPFDVTDRKYMQAYFKYLHHPYEEMGVDFWWVDWQQGSQSRTKGIDPLWMLNHLHFMDSAREGSLPLTFSRYAGLGSHRYPIGFSGDTVSSWESLSFQPFFTANASNVGYCWWSHDIGGHQKGCRDDELIVRWIQLGVFSPIMRLHSTSNPFYGKEPWNYNMMAEKVITSFLQLRHRLIPYLHTMNYRTHLQGIPLIQPMYYNHDVVEAYQVPGEYYFGDLIVCPVTSPADKETLLAEVDVWLPEGIYYDFFTGQVYSGDQKMLLYRSQNTIPVLAEAGTIIPMAEDYKKCYQENPKNLEVIVFNGANGVFEMYEDDCSNSAEMEVSVTKFTYQCGKNASFSMQIVKDRENVIPENRTYTIRIRGMEQVDFENIEIHDVKADNQIHAESSYDHELMELTVKVTGERITQFILEIKNTQGKIAAKEKNEMIKAILHQAQIEYDLKKCIYRIVSKESDKLRIISQLHELKLKDALFGAILECLVSD